VLVTSLTEEVRSVAQHYRDRGDAETLRRVEEPVGVGRVHDTRPEALPDHGADHGLVYNWWTIFMRLGIADNMRSDHLAATALHGIARQTRHGNQTNCGDHEQARGGVKDRENVTNGAVS